MSSPLQYKVYRRVTGDTGREYLAAFAGCADAYAYALEKSGDKYRPDNSTLTVTGWDGRVWWKFDAGVHINKPKALKPGILGDTINH